MKRLLERVGLCMAARPITSARMPTMPVTQLLRRRRLPAIVILALPLLGLAACTGSPATLAMQPAFGLETPMGPASISIREPLPSMTDSETEELVRTAMQQALPGTMHLTPIAAPFPRRRIVWHVNPDPPGGTSRLVLNIFDGSAPVWYEQEVVANDAPRSAVTGTIEWMTRRLAARYGDRNDPFPGQGSISSKAAPLRTPAAGDRG